MIAETLLLVSLGTPAWMRWAQCADADPELFHPEPGEDNSPRVRAALRICKSCPVQFECLRWAYQTEDKFAILGGRTPNQRTRVLRRIRRHGA